MSTYHWVGYPKCCRCESHWLGMGKVFCSSDWVGPCCEPLTPEGKLRDLEKELLG